MDPFPDPTTLSAEELDEQIAELAREQDEISYRRRLLHGRIDLLRDEVKRRAKEHIAHGDELPLPDPGDLERPIFEGTGELPPGGDLPVMPDLESLGDEELHGMIRELEVEEDEVSFHRRNIQGRLDMLKAARAGEPLDVEHLAQILASRPGRPQPGTGGQ